MLCAAISQSLLPAWCQISYGHGPGTNPARIAFASSRVRRSKSCSAHVFIHAPPELLPVLCRYYVHREEEMAGAPPFMVIGEKAKSFLCRMFMPRVARDGACQAKLLTIATGLSER